MINVLAAGLCGAFVSLGTAYATIWFMNQPASTQSASTKVEQVKTKIITFPVTMEGRVEGYTRIGFAFGIEKNELQTLSVKPDIILVDQAYKSLAEISFANPRRPSRSELETLTNSLRTTLNQRMGKDIIKEILIQEYSFIPTSAIRDKARTSS